MKTVLILLSLLSLVFGDCNECPKVHFDSTAGLADEYSRYMGTWVNQGLYEGKAFYSCIDCQGLYSQMIYQDNSWQIVDCRPDQTQFCGGSHVLIYSSEATPASCPEDNIAPWFYCDGDIIVGGGCTHYSSDFTAAFTCVE